MIYDINNTIVVLKIRDEQGMSTMGGQGGQFVMRKWKNRVYGLNLTKLRPNSVKLS